MPLDDEGEAEAVGAEVPAQGGTICVDAPDRHRHSTWPGASLFALPYARVEIAERGIAIEGTQTLIIVVIARSDACHVASRTNWSRGST